MKPFSALTFRGQILRLRQASIQALADYPIEVDRVRYLTTESTTMFRVEAADGQKYVFRLYSELDSSLAENEAEIFWLTRLAKDTGLRLTAPVPRSDGGYISRVRVAGLPVEKRAVLYRWVPGVQLAEHVSPASYRQLGSIMARLHNHAETLALPDHIRPKRWDRVFYYPDEPQVFNTPGFVHLFDPAQVDLLERSCARLDAFLAGLYGRGQPMLIHADLHFWNVHVYRGELYVIDFEDILLGYPLQDIAICLYYLRSRADYPELAAAFETGYRAERDWPVFTQGELHLLWAARMTNFINYVAQQEDEAGARQFINSRCEELAQLLPN